MAVVRSTEEIEAVKAEAEKAQAKGTKYPAMTYEDGVTETLRWLTGETDASPMSDD